VGGLRAAVVLPVGRSHAARERGAGGGVAPRALPPLLLHLHLLDVVLNDLAVDVFLHLGPREREGGAGGTVSKQPVHT